MADVLIRGMEMPKNCAECPCFSKWDDCGINHEWKFADEFDKTKDRLPSCPFLPIPAGHGRLIDGTDLYAVLDGGFDVDLDELPETKDAILSMIQSAETIVPAEGSKIE